MLNVKFPLDILTTWNAKPCPKNLKYTDGTKFSLGIFSRAVCNIIILEQMMKQMGYAFQKEISSGVHYYTELPWTKYQSLKYYNIYEHIARKYKGPYDFTSTGDDETTELYAEIDLLKSKLEHIEGYAMML